jgi:hypothetical protein
MKKILICLSILVLAFTVTGNANAEVIDFTGGTAYSGPGVMSGTTNNSDLFLVDYYEESGFKVDFIGDSGYVGDYYGAENDVIHAHWPYSGSTLESIHITKIGGGTFDLDYFILTSNTILGGGLADGSEVAVLEASNGYKQILPSEDWGFNYTSGGFPTSGSGSGYTQIYLDSNYDNITSFTFTAQSDIYCFGMDEFYINEAQLPPPVVPEPISSILFVTGGTLMAGRRLLKRRKTA